MEINITQKDKSTLLGREEIKGKVSFSGKTPTRQEFRKELAKKLGAGEELLVVKKIKMLYGHQAADFTADLYSKKEEMQKIETEPILGRNFGRKEKKEEKKEEA